MFSSSLLPCYFLSAIILPTPRPVPGFPHTPALPAHHSCTGICRPVPIVPIVPSYRRPPLLSLLSDLRPSLAYLHPTLILPSCSYLLPSFSYRPPFYPIALPHPPPCLPATCLHLTPISPYYGPNLPYSTHLGYPGVIILPGLIVKDAVSSSSRS